jgi:DNA-binding NtrC family response regulator
MGANDDIAGDMSFRTEGTAPSRAAAAGEEHVDLKAVVERLELDYMTGAYARYGNVRDAAESLGMDPSTFVRKRRRYAEALQDRN